MFAIAANLGDWSECLKVLGKLQLQQIHEPPVSRTHLLNAALERVGTLQPSDSIFQSDKKGRILGSRSPKLGVQIWGAEVKRARFYFHVFESLGSEL